MTHSCTKKSSGPTNKAGGSYTATPGKVWIVGAGPGDADLLTIKAARLIASADVIMYDALVSDDIKALFPASTTCIYVGKRKGRHAIDQEGINQMLINQAKAGFNVCRLKGGDPYVFGRGGEEALAAVAEGIDVEVVPGITAASGCAAIAGIPLTHRGITQGCTFVTAHARAEAGVEVDSSINWASLAQSGNTLVFYMGLSKIEQIRSQLCQHGKSAATPVAVIERGCTPQQRVLVSDLAKVGQVIIDEQVAAPALIVVGDVVSLHEQLSQNTQTELNHTEQLSA